MKLITIAGVVIALLAVGVVAWAVVMSMVETPRYEVVDRDGRFEVRDYPALLVAEVDREGARQDAVRSGFRALAGYIFARERDGEAIAMTAPVLQARGGEAEAPWRVGFVMPSRYALDDLPSPGRTDVRLRRIDDRRLAAVRFSGAWSDVRFAEQEEALRAWMAERDLAPAGPAIIAYYNDPWTPGFLRRNEVLIETAGP